MNLLLNISSLEMVPVTNDVILLTNFAGQFLDWILIARIFSDDFLDTSLIPHSRNCAIKHLIKTGNAFFLESQDVSVIQKKLCKE